MNRIIGIAINNYDDSNIKNLNNCLNDINSIVSVLKRKYKFDDFELLTQKEQTSRKYLYNNLRELLLNSLEEDNILIIYAGHGEYDYSINNSFILPSDAVYNDSSTWFNVNELLQFIKASKAQHVTVISDSCFLGAIVNGISRGGGIDAINSRKSRLALSSGGLEKVTDGYELDNSPFTSTVCKILEDNQAQEITFNRIAENVILNFGRSEIQTPAFGELSNTGHEGGSFVFELNDSHENLPKFKIEDYYLNLNLGLPINIDYNCKIPLFTSSNYFDVNFINSSIQSNAFRVLSDSRKIILDSYDFLIERGKELPIGLDINYEIKYLDENYLSLVLIVYSYMGGPYPNDFVYSINLSFKPDLLLTLRDVIPLNPNFEEKLKQILMTYADEEIRESICHYIEYVNEENLDFAFNKDKIFIYMLNHLPRVIHAAGYVEASAKDLEIMINLK